ncbi:MAG: class I SAM-dependent methyltransferase [Candidatus Eisenbacteria bacterium]|jgi:SAM-dependent methyltransferase|nr:class I SAM-dependent methyltransferase [Candidatus Eisenbacteria bacterium]
MIDYDKLAADYAAHRTVHPGVLAELLEAINEQDASRIMEVGCGTGNYIRTIGEGRAVQCVGIDPSEGMLRQARKRAPGIEFLAGTAETLDFDPDFFDLVFSVDVIHHVGDRMAFFRGEERVLRPGGRICTVTDSEDIIRRREPLVRYFPETVDVELRRYPGIPVLEREMVEAGFTGIRESRVEASHSLSIIGPYRDRVFSSLLLISEAAFLRGIARMEEDLARGPIPCVSRYALIWGRAGGPRPPSSGFRG